MNFSDYQKLAMKTDVFGGKKVPLASGAFMAQILGLMGETGEIAEKFKKIYRDQNGEITPEQVQDMKKELGDVLWYIASVSSYLGIKMEDVATHNIEKLASRQKRGKLSGSGDNR